MPHRSGLRALGAPAVALAALLAGGEPGAAADAGAGGWKAGEPTPIAVRDGSATFSVPNDGGGRELLVVVSSLSREAGPYPVRLSARSVERARPVDRAEAPPAGRPAPAPAPIPGDPDAESPPPSLPPPPRRDFHILVREGDVGVAGNYQAVRGALRAVGRRVQVYVAEDDAGLVDDATLADAVAAFDEHVRPVAARTIGLAADADGDGRFTILFSSRLTRLGGGRHAVDGYVRVTDFDPSYPPPFGDRCDMMHLSTALRAGPYLRTVMAHEYTHAVVFTRKALQRPDAPVEEEGWLDEALAHLCEDQHGFTRANLDYRVSAFLSRPERYRLTVGDYYAADLFRSHGNRGSTYLFLRWCADRYGPGLLPALVGSGLRGEANLEAATGRRFEDLFRDWAFDLYARPDAASYAGFRGGGGWPPAGPRPARAAVDGRADAWEAAGTSPHYALVDCGRAGAVEVRVEGPDAADLQVTAAFLPRSPRLELAARAYRTARGDLMLRASVREAAGRGVRLLALAWEPVAPPVDAHRSPLHPGRLDAQGLREAFGVDALPASAGVDSRPIPLDPRAHAGPLVLKLMGVDEAGRPVTAWATLGEDDPVAASTLAREAPDAPPRR